MVNNKVMSSVLNKICFDKSEVSLYLFLLIIILIYLTYIIYQTTYKYSSLQKITVVKAPNNTTNGNDTSNNDTYSNKKSIVNENVEIQRKFLDKLYNPLTPPENVIESGTFYTPRYDAYTTYQNIGYLTGNGTQYSVFGRWMYPNKSDKWQYYVINNERSRIKIPFKTKNNNELYDNDIIDIPELGNGFVFKKYENEGMRYNPNIF